MAYPRILITGGGGRLAKALVPHLPWVRLLTRLDLDVTRCPDFRPRDGGADIIIHCAAVLSMEAEKDHLKAWAVNVEGTGNVATAASRNGCKLVYISSDYVFDGRRDYVFDGRRIGPARGYHESDPCAPVNFYGVTKRAGELAALASPNNLVVRAPFRYTPWPYDNAFCDQWTSSRWINEAAPDIARAALSDLTGIIHIGGPRRSLYDMAIAGGFKVKKSYRADWPGIQLPEDTSLDSSRWLAFASAKAAA
jgi:dTDP-4-dehydrorhamnose reductase